MRSREGHSRRVGDVCPEVRQGDAEGLQAHARLYRPRAGAGPHRRRSHHGRLRGKRPRYVAGGRKLKDQSSEYRVASSEHSPTTATPASFLLATRYSLLATLLFHSWANPLASSN